MLYSKSESESESNVNNPAASSSLESLESMITCCRRRVVLVLDLDLDFERESLLRGLDFDRDLGFLGRDFCFFDRD